MANLEVIQKRFLADNTIYGNIDEISTPSGKRIPGCYILTECGAVTPSHDPLNLFRKSEGFPTDAHGQSVNDRDYERDSDAQQITRNIAASYDSRALQTPIIVSKDGAVLSGNGRTMAGILAARDNTDGEYINYLLQFSQKYGFSKEDVQKFKHPRLVFKASEDYPYTAETFAMFNAQDIKSQSKTEQAVKLGKLVDDETFHRIIRNINTFDTIGDFYNNAKAATEAINNLLAAGVISQMQYPEMFDGESISSLAREILENVLIGKAFSKNGDAVRQITAFKSVRRNVITALSEISNNIALNDYSLEKETSEAIALCYQARSNGKIGHGEIVSGFARQMTMFEENSTVANHTDSVVLFLADLLNHSQVTRLKRVFALYNNEAKDAASGQVDIFSGSVKTKAEILTEVKQVFATLSQNQLDQKLSNAAFERRIDAVSEISEDTPNEPDAPTLPKDVVVGGYCTVILPSHKTETAKLECIIGNEACVRLKGWKRMRVPITSLLALVKDAA